MNPTRKCLDCQKNKIVHNFHTTNPKEINQSIKCRQKYDLYEKKFNLISRFWVIFYSARQKKLDFFWYNFCSHAPIEIKIILSQRYYVFLYHEKVSKSFTKN